MKSTTLLKFPSVFEQAEVKITLQQRERLQLNKATDDTLAFEHNFYFLKEGLIKVSAFNQHNKEAIKHIIGSGEIIGEEVLYSGQPNQDYITALQESLIYIFDLAFIKKRVIEDKELELFILNMAINRIQSLESRLNQSLDIGAYLRVKLFLCDFISTHGLKTGNTFIIDHILTYAEIAHLTFCTEQEVMLAFEKLQFKKHLAIKHGQWHWTKKASS